MKILFLNPPTPDNEKYIREGRCMQLTSSWAAIWPPISLATMAAMAEAKGCEAVIFDANVEEIAFDNVHTVAAGCDLVVLNTSFPTIDSDLDVARKLRVAVPGVIIVGFGVYFTLVGEASLPPDGCVDYAIAGEPDEAFSELLDVLLEGRHVTPAVKGLLYRENGRCVYSGDRPLIKELDRLPHPARHLMQNERYVLPNNGEPFTLVNTSRGCPFECTFCIVKGYYGRKVRRHSTGYILDEIQECVEEYGLKNFLLWEEAFTLNRDVVEEFCLGLRKRGLDINWAVTTRADSVDRRTLELMKDTGCFLVGMGIESSSQEILDLAKKNETIEDIVAGVKMCNAVGLPVMGHFIFGLPGETRRTAEETIRFSGKIGLTYLQSYCAVPYPGTEFGDLARKNGWVKEGKWSTYDFGGDSIVDMPGLTGKEVTAFRRKAFRRFYFRPRMILSHLYLLLNPRVLRQALSFLRWTR